MESAENQPRVSHRFPQPLEIAARFPHSHCHRHDCLYSKSNPKKGPLLPVPHFPASGSFFNENMLKASSVFFAGLGARGCPNLDFVKIPTLLQHPDQQFRTGANPPKTPSHTGKGNDVFVKTQ
jgi:hypothetical protein